MHYPVISLFSGAMGLDLGLEKAGLHVAVSQDIDPWCVKTMIVNNRRHVSGDIRKLVAEQPNCDFLLRAGDIARDEVFAVVGGPPCQPFSTAGKRLAINDPRGSLFTEFINVIRAIRPRFFVMENVKGLLSASVRQQKVEQKNRISDPDELPGSVFKIILDTFSQLDYKIDYGLLDAVHYGVPQFRERLIIIGSRDNEDIFLPFPTHFQKHQDSKNRWQTLRDTIIDIEDAPGPCASFSAERLKYLKMIPMGGNWRSLAPELIPLAMGGAYMSGGGKVGFYRRLDYDQPSPTLVTSPVQKATMLCHPTKNRPLSVNEYARIQQFPSEWAIEGNINDCYRQIGNAVPIGLGNAIGQSLISTALKVSSINTKRMRGTAVHNIMQKIQKPIASTDSIPYC
ncbi:DNA cytosine methyltransferase [Anaerospora hongkongensis]|uniref:DNA cytosine methyltransferase n=1 Tax=Anaerospora hongkongensis TaxID=244830 RepID=UPI00289BACCF|nr:DNA cytosine methyltransferase [Anaerospora hongkongensis]